MRLGLSAARTSLARKLSPAIHITAPSSAECDAPNCKRNLGSAIATEFRVHHEVGAALSTLGRRCARLQNNSASRRLCCFGTLNLDPRSVWTSRFCLYDVNPPHPLGSSRLIERQVVNENSTSFVNDSLWFGVISYPRCSLRIQGIGRCQLGMVVLVLHHLKHLVTEIRHAHSPQPLGFVYTHSLRTVMLDIGVPDGCLPLQPGHISRKILVTVNLNLMPHAENRVPS